MILVHANVTPTKFIKAIYKNVVYSAIRQLQYIVLISKQFHQIYLFSSFDIILFILLTLI